VYGRKYDALRQAVTRLHPALDAWMLQDGYGKVLARPGLSLAQRELCIVAACAASEQLPQLRSHLRGALNCGATLEDLAQTLTALTDIVPREALGVAREELNRIREN
jgi:4-carboxymuconolactone decarboxylase